MSVVIHDNISDNNIIITKVTSFIESTYITYTNSDQGVVTVGMIN